MEKTKKTFLTNPICPKSCMGHTYAKMTFVVYRKLNLTGHLFLFWGLFCGSCLLNLATPLQGCVPGQENLLLSLSTCCIPKGPHLSAGAHWGKGIRPTHEHFPASDDQDSHVVLTLLLKQEGEVVKGLALQAQCWVSFFHTPSSQIFQSPPLCPSCTLLSSGGSRGLPYLLGRLSAHCPCRCSGLSLTCTVAPAHPVWAQSRRLCAYSVPDHPRNHKPPAGSQPGPQTTKATYLSLPFALAGAERVLVGGPLGGLWEEHTDITQLCYSPPGQAAVGVWRGQEAGKERVRDSQQGQSSSHYIHVDLGNCQISLPRDL